MSHALLSLFGPDLLSTAAASPVPTADALKGCEAVAVYFSAHWCPPCRGFTPKLAASFKALQDAGKPFQCVFVSSDRDEAAFSEYFAEMPWLALPYADRERKDALSKKFGVSGIPKLVILDGDGKVITHNGREALSGEHAQVVEQFPWRPPTLREALGETFVNAQGAEVMLDSVLSEGKHLALYFSAHWCPPCRGFTPKLVETYKKLQDAGKPFEVLFVSSDRDQASFDEYRASMPWLALPFSDRARKARISQHFEVNGIPQLVILSPELKVVNKNARGAVSADVEGQSFPWTPKTVIELEECESINETATLVLLAEEASDLWDDLEASLARVANKFLAAAPEDEETNFCVSKETGGISGQIRKLLKLGKPGSKPEMVLLDPEGSYAVHEGAVDESSMLTFLNNFRAGTLKMQSLQ